MIAYRNIGHDWQFTQEQMQFREKQIELLEKHYNANGLLIEYLSRHLRKRESREYGEIIDDL